jgi:hypothetical protein
MPKYPVCPAPVIKCNDPSCQQHYKKHYTCGSHQLHLGDNICEGSRCGFIYDANPVGSKRSVVVKWNDGTFEGIFGYATCNRLVKTGGRTKHCCSNN